MDIWCGLTDVPEDLDASVVTIGVFDGVHRGHRALISRASQIARERGQRLVMVTFDPHPIKVFLPGHQPTQLANLADRLAMAGECGVDAALVIDFTKELAGQSAHDYFTSMIRDTLKASAVIVGENFTFGAEGAGTSDTMTELGAEYGIDVEILPLLHDDGECICSSLVRDYLSAGDVAAANWALGRTYSVTGEVVRGAGRGGRELGYPTANLYFPDSVALPADGVYAGWFTVLDDVEVDGDIDAGTRYRAAVSVGTNPTFGDERRSVEAFVLDRDADLYGHRVTVEFVAHIRGMVKFSGVDELLEAIGNDVSHTREILDGEA